MLRKLISGARASVVFYLFVLALITTLAVLPARFVSSAVSGGPNNGLVQRTSSDNPELPYYDIRLIRNFNKTGESAEAFEKYRQETAQTEAALANIKSAFVTGEEALRRRVPGLKVEYNDDLQVPEIIGTDVLTRDVLASTGISANEKHADVVRGFLRENNNLVGMGDDQITSLKTIADYTNPDGNLSYVDLAQEINGVPVFRGEIRAGITKDGRIFRMVNNLAPGLDYENLSKDFGRPEDAVFAAARHINREATADDLKQIGTKFNGNIIEFDRGQFADPTTAERMYFPTEPGVAVPAWRVLLYEPVAAYYVVVDTEGRMLWRKNITNDQTQAATYNVYDSDSPAPLSPTTALPGTMFQAPAVARVNFTLIGNEPPNPGMNNLGWMTDGTNGVNGHTDGNNAEAGLDVVAPDGVDAPVPGVMRVFSFAYTPGVGLSPAPGDAPTVPAFQSGMVTNMFYWANRYHDVLYSVGFTEAARNFQNDNFGRGGVALDRLRVEGQDSSGTNNANFLTPADGGRGRSQMYRFTGPTPNRDSGIDMDVLIHELTHGLSNRLIGNSTGLGNNRGGSMGEGWSDFYARVLLSTASEDVNGIYTTGGWVTLQFAGAAFTDNYYYGIRRFPYAVRTNIGGPGMLPHNPQTFADIDTAQINNTDGAYPRSPLIGNTATEVHNAGEIWCMNLLEVRARIISRLGFAAGNQRMLQLTTDGMKLTPTSPTFTQARDAILSASQALGGTDTPDVWAGFASRGQGFGSSDSNANSAVVESFNLPNAVMTDPFSVSDSTGDNDGFPEPGENVLLSVAVTNNTGSTVNSVTASVTGGGTANYGNIANGSTVTRQIAYTVPGGAVCGSLHQVTMIVSSSIATNAPEMRGFRLGAPVGGPPVTFANNTALAIPDSGPSAPYGTSINVAGLTGNKLLKLEITGVTHTFPGDLDFLLVGPGGTTKYIGLSDSGSGGDVSNLTFTLSDAAATQPSTTQWVAGDFRPYNTGANDAFVAPAPAAPYTNAAPGGTDTFTSVFGQNSANLNGTWSLYLVDDAGGDSGSLAGWKLTFEANDYTCALTNVRSPFDFDGDSKTDLSIFRPSNGQWWYQRSSDSMVPAVQFGTGTDKMTPGDFTGDRKTDIAFFRPSTGSWFVLRSEDLAFYSFPFGANGDVPIPADFDGDGKADPAVFRPSSAQWFILRSSDNQVTFSQFGASTDKPIPADYDGDGKADIGIFRPSDGTWWYLRSSDSQLRVYGFGSSTDRPTPGDFTGDGKADIAFWRPSTGSWFVLRSEDLAFYSFPFGGSGDVPVAGDYDGDGRRDAAVFRPSNATWYVNRSTAGLLIQGFGLTTDAPVPSAFVP